MILKSFNNFYGVTVCMSCIMMSVMMGGFITITMMMMLVVTRCNQIRLIKGVAIIGQGTDHAKSHSSGEPAGSFECHHSAN